MRPKKKILLVGATEDRLSVLKYLLWINGYAVIGAAASKDALERLILLDYDLLLCELPLAGVEDLLIQGRNLNPSMHALAIGEISAEIAASLCADIIYQNRPFKNQPSPAEILDRVKVMTARKRGPLSRRKPPLHEPLIVAAETERIA
jgi:DNA-binding response OmpR family regulator